MTSLWGKKQIPCGDDRSEMQTQKQILGFAKEDRKKSDRTERKATEQKEGGQAGKKGERTERKAAGQRERRRDRKKGDRTERRATQEPAIPR
jgi:hypothetical protein